MGNEIFRTIDQLERGGGESYQQTSLLSLCVKFKFKDPMCNTKKNSNQAQLINCTYKIHNIRKAIFSDTD